MISILAVAAMTQAIALIGLAIWTDRLRRRLGEVQRRTWAHQGLWEQQLAINKLQEEALEAIEGARRDQWLGRN